MKLVANTSCTANMCTEQPECMVCKDAVVSQIQYVPQQTTSAVHTAPPAIYFFDPHTESSELSLDYCADSRHSCSYLCEKCWLAIAQKQNTCPICRGGMKPPKFPTFVWTEVYDPTNFR
eukprot:2506462-Rhodomonas_salina.2